MSLKLASVLAAAITAGLMAGVFGLYAHTIMRGLGNADDRTFVAAFQSIDRAIINPLFMLAFLGALVFSGVAVLLYLRDDGGKQVPWLIAAFALYLAVVVITVSIHLPLNDDIKAAGDPDRLTDLAAVRENFHETRWVAWNIVRAIATTVAFGCLAWALVLDGRSTGADTDESARPAAVERPVAGSLPSATHAHETPASGVGDLPT